MSTSATRTSAAGRQQRAARVCPSRSKTSPPLGTYTHPDGSRREVVIRPGAGDRTLVIDREERTRGDARLVAALEPDEPPENARIVCELYLADPADRHCRSVTAEDALEPDPADEIEPTDEPDQQAAELTDAAGARYRIEPIAVSDGSQRLRWTKLPRGACADPAAPIALRELVGAMQDYSPALEMTENAIEGDSRAATLRTELTALQESPRILNRRLREQLIAAVQRGEVTLSEVAIRCGHVKRGRNGNESGETSWLTRRVGLKPELLGEPPSPWIESRVLAQIAIALGLNPCEVEMR